MASFRYEWKKDETNLNLPLPNIARGSDGDIIINPATEKDQGAYYCFASNQHGTAFANFDYIQTAIFKDDSTNSEVVIITVSEGRPFVIPADRSKSLPAPKYNWEIVKSAVDPAPRPIQQSPKMQIAFNGNGKL